MKYLVGLFLLACAAASAANKPAPLPTMDGLAGTWVGSGMAGMEFYRLELDANGVGVLASLFTFSTQPSVHMFQVNSWRLSKRRIFIEASSETYPGEESLSISGEVIGQALDLRVKAKYRSGASKWNLQLTREASALNAFDALREAMNRRSAQGKQ